MSYTDIDTDTDTFDQPKELYQRFIDKLWLKYRYKLEDIANWTHAGWFPNGMTEELKKTWVGERLNNYNDKARLGIQKWKHVMGDIDMPYDYSEPACVCDVEIMWNHIIVDDPRKDEFEILILGSECITGFLNIDLGCKCSLCGCKINNSQSGKCKDCKKLRFCESPGCNKQLVKYSRGEYCSERCEFPHRYCPTRGCFNMKKIYKDKYMPTCFSCYRKKNPKKYNDASDWKKKNSYYT